MDCVVIVIPSYQPADFIIHLCQQLICDNSYIKIVVVDDGSGNDYKDIFDRLSVKAIVLHHQTNSGKGAALKTGFKYVLNHFPEAIGCVTADADGQHSVIDILQCRQRLIENRNSLILGCRNFDQVDIPWKSKMGNRLTRRLCSYFIGIAVSDTQTGLRGIPTNYMSKLLNEKSNGYEFEMKMLIDSKSLGIPILEFPIETIYKDNNRGTHFRPIQDSFRIYYVLGARFIKYIISSLSSSVIDLFIFALVCWKFRESTDILVVPAAAVVARMVSIICNFGVNSKYVFESKKTRQFPFIKYALLAAIQTTLSIIFVLIGTKVFQFLPKVFIKAVTDTVLFFFSYKIQHKHIFG